MTRCTTTFIAACWLLAASAGLAAPPESAPGQPGDPRNGGDCLACHPAARPALAGPMSTRDAERRFVCRAFGHEEGDRFFARSCGGCHVSSCRDCHGDAPHLAGKPADEACLRCHRGYFVGGDYHGRAPREDHARYRRGPTAGGEPFLKMLPDVHREIGRAHV